MAPRAKFPSGMAPQSSQPSPGTSNGVTKKARKGAGKKSFVSREFLQRAGVPVGDLPQSVSAGDGGWENPDTRPEVGSPAYMARCRALGYAGQDPPAPPPNQIPAFPAQSTHLGLNEMFSASGPSSPSPWTNSVTGIGQQNAPAPTLGQGFVSTVLASNRGRQSAFASAPSRMTRSAGVEILRTARAISQAGMLMAPAISRLGEFTTTPADVRQSLSPPSPPPSTSPPGEEQEQQ